jgi:hypothetical protein
LQYLELWIGTSEYGGDSFIEDLMPIISGEKFPNLKYLSLRNCDYTNDIAFELAKSPFLKQLLELDLSLGTLENNAFLALINSPFINELDLLNVSKNYIDVNQRYEIDIFPLLELKCWIKIDKQEQVEYYDGRTHRHCWVRE